MKLLIDLIGWAGAIAVLLAYALVSARRIDAASNGYHWMNLGGAAGLMMNTFYYAAYPSTALNFVWGLIALLALWRLRAGRSRLPPESHH